ncbi:MAG: GTPase ObgE [bacterium]
MKFIDEAIIEVTAGNGGNGCVSFRREKYVPRGGPDGGDGGRGGSVIFRTESGLTTLMDIRYRRHFKAGHGGHGMGKQMTGRDGEDKLVLVPAGTAVFDAETGGQVADLDGIGAEWVAAKGGRGGRGNQHFATATHQAPRKAEQGGMGESFKLKLELKLLADVGLVGLPNAGKSTLISAVSNARPKIAAYPFTTKVPSLGLARLPDGRGFVIADIPGLIEGAHEGAGMGIQFLRHIERTKVLLHLIDPVDPAHEDAASCYKTIRAELGAFDGSLLDRPEIVVLTKMDIPEARAVKADAERKIKKLGAKAVVAISAAAHDGLEELLIEIGRALH